MSFHSSYINKPIAKVSYTVLGISPAGCKFRPSDWTERLICLHSKQLKKYDGHLKIRNESGIKSIVFDDLLEDACPVTYNRILDFAKINSLTIIKKTIEV
jgi:hypothetical protein